MNREFQPTTLQVILLHLLPGLPFLVAYQVARQIASPEIPAFTLLLLASLFVLVPLELGLTVWLCRREGRPVFSPRFTEYCRWPGTGRFFLLGFALLLWAVFVFAVLENWLEVGSMLRDILFPGHDPRGEPGDLLRHPEDFSDEQMRWAAILALLVGALIAPITEEVYFRGKLLPLLGQWGRAAPLIHTALFAAYHLWSPWLIPTRILATLPFFWVAYRERSIYPALFAHCLINLMGDGLPLLAIVLS